MAEAQLAVNFEQLFRVDDSAEKVRWSSEALLKQASLDGDQTLRVVGLCKAAEAEMLSGAVAAALEKVEAAKALSQEHFLAEATAAVKYQLARIYARDLGNAESLDHALDLTWQALEGFQKLGQRVAEAASKLQLGDMYGLLKQEDAAIRYHKEALAIFKEVGDHSFCGSARHKLAKDYLAKGQHLRAAQAAERAIGSYQAAGEVDQAQQGDCWITLAEAQSQAMDVPKVQESIAQARKLFAALQDSKAEARAMAALVKSHVQNGSQVEAVDTAKQVVTHFREAGDRHGECHALLSLAKLLLPLDHEKADRIAAAAIELMQGLGMSQELQECRELQARCQHAKASAEVEGTIWKRRDFLHVPRSLVIDPGCRGRLQNEFANFAKGA